MNVYNVLVTGTTTMRTKAVEYNPFLYERLKEEAYALDYLKAVMQNENSRVFFNAH